MRNLFSCDGPRPDSKVSPSRSFDGLDAGIAAVDLIYDRDSQML